MEERQTFERLIVIAIQTFRGWSAVEPTRRGSICEEAALLAYLVMICHFSSDRYSLGHPFIPGRHILIAC